MAGGFIIGRGRYARGTYATPPPPAGGGGSPTGPAGGDLDGTYPDPGVAAVNGVAFDLGTPGPGQDGFVVTWVNADGNFQVLSPSGGPPSGPAGGDLTGTYPDPTVASLQTNTLTLGTLGAGEDGFVLTWVNGESQLVMQAVPSQPPSGPAGGDLSGDYPDPGVAQVDGSPFDINDPQVGDVLAWDGSNWVNSTSLTDLISTVTALQGQVTDLSTTVTALQGQVTDLQGQVTDLTNTVTALQEQVDNLSNGMGFNLANGGAVPPNVLYEGTQLFSVTT